MKWSKSRPVLLLLILAGLLLTPACTLASPFDKLLAMAVTATPVSSGGVTFTPRPTFTSTPAWTATPTHTPTPTLTPIPTNTPTPPSPTATRTPRATPTPTPTLTSTPAPPPPPTKPPEPTATPTPGWEFQLAELYSYPTQATILSIITAVQAADGNWIPGYRVVGRDPNGLVTKSEVSADQMTGHTPADTQVVKAGNTKFEPQPVAIYITGDWIFHLETADGRQVSADFTVTMDTENRQWYFFRFQPN